MNLIGLVLIAISTVIIVSDIKERKISNRLNLVVLVCCLLIAYEYENIELHILRSTLVLTVGLVIFSLGIIGAGDIKLLSIYALIIDSQYWTLSLVTIGFIGGITALIILIKSKIVKNGKNKGVPYGVPIVFSSLFFIHLSALS
ncbi:prepilin peptidase [Enterovibrio makurazakiensis]|uniref:Prepilin peptidase n=1 Tax=Enterovibrio gelatinilyticus TaxID=2899819 RepID=A0ABT5R305_9GAMM|nr:prepilin peptidase [Enterovibrio sp. ZSDZ42]MDD1794656.1 prepilin peptidase [Enterovibrio sp. ZSDZ42]